MANSIDVTIQTAPITVTIDDGTTVLVGAGTVGPAGATGAAGQGVPTGGTTGQVLAKKTGTNYDTEWVDQTGGGGGGGSGTVTSVTGTAPISVATGTTTPVVSIAAATTSADGYMTSTQATKLAGIATGATANSTDAQLRDRSTHTGTQALSTISDAGTAAAKNAPATGNASATEVVLGSDTRLTDARTPSAHKASHATGGTDALAPSDIGAVPTTRTVNGSALTADITISAAPSGSAGGDLTGTYPNPTIGTGKVTVAKLSATGTADSTTFLRGDGSWSAPTATVADGSISTAKIADSAVTSAKIADGTIVDADVNAAAAIAASKISGLATVATSGSASDLSTGTVASARLSTKAVGGQGSGSTVTEPTTATSLLTSTVTIPACAAGDVLIINAGVNFTQNSGTSKTYTFALKLGATTILSLQPTVSSSATGRVMHLHAIIRVLTTTSQSGAMTVVFNTNSSAATAVPYAMTGTATETISSGSLALDLLATTSASGATQTLVLQSFSVTKVAA